MLVTSGLSFIGSFFNVASAAIVVRQRKVVDRILRRRRRFRLEGLGGVGGSSSAILSNERHMLSIVWVIGVGATGNRLVAALMTLPFELPSAFGLCAGEVIIVDFMTNSTQGPL